MADRVIREAYLAIREARKLLSSNTIRCAGFTLTPEQEEQIHQLRQEIVDAGETNSKGGPSCGVTAEELGMMLGGSETYGAYQLSDGSKPDHAWVTMPDGTIIDATGDQFGNPPIQVIPADHPDHALYLDQEGDDYF